MQVTRKITGALCAVALSLGALTSAAKAEDKFGYSASIAIVSDYIFRGISFNEEDPAFQPYIEFTYGQWYLAFWGSNIDALDTYGPWEVDIYAGVRPVTGPISWDLAVWYYQYGSQDRVAGISSGDLDYFELKAAGTVNPAENFAVTVTGYYAPEQDIATAETWSGDVLAAYTLPNFGMFTPTISGQVGYFAAIDAAPGYFQGEANEYWFWNAGVKLAVENFFMDLRYWDTELDADFADERFLFTVGVNLP